MPELVDVQMRKGTSDGVLTWISAARLRASVLVLVSALAFADPSIADLQVREYAWFSVLSCVFASRWLL